MTTGYANKICGAIEFIPQGVLIVYFFEEVVLMHFAIVEYRIYWVENIFKICDINQCCSI